MTDVCLTDIIVVGRIGSGTGCGNDLHRPVGSQAESFESKGPQAVRPCALCNASHADSFDAFRCCACPETKSARDDCFFRYDSDEATEKCKELVQAHIACMRGYGFKV